MKTNYPVFYFLYTPKQQALCLPCKKFLRRLKTFFLLLLTISSLLAFSLPNSAQAQKHDPVTEPFGFGTTGEPAPSTRHPGSLNQSSPWGPLVNVRSGVVPGAQENGNSLPQSPQAHDPSINVWEAPKEQAEIEDEGSQEDLPWDLSALKVTGYNTNQILEAEGQVLLQRGHEYLKADYARYYAATGWIYLQGNVEVYFGKDRLTAREAEFDIANKIGWLKEGQVFMEGPHVYFSGSRINKYWGDMYTFREAKITTCDGDVPAWSMSAEEAVVEIDGYARLWNTQFAIKDQSVVYSPYMILPAKKDRQTGLLIPDAGYSTDKGVMYNQPFFWAIDKSQDLTIDADIMTKRGVMLGTEYWARPDLEDQIWMRMDWLADAETSSTDSGDGYNDGLLRTNNQRFWLRGAYNGSITNSRWRVKANIDYTSDQYFLREFKNRPGGYEDNKTTLLDLFGRDLNPWSSNRVSEAQIYREWDRVSFYGGMRYEEDPVLGHGNAPHSTDTIAQKLPEFNMYLNKGKIIDNLPLEVVAESQIVNFWRRKGAMGQRYDIYPEFSIPIHTKYVSIEPSVGLRQTQYQTENKKRIEGDTGDNSKTSRSVGEFNITAFSELARVYDLNKELEATKDNVGSSRWLSMRHSIQPRINYHVNSDEDQADLPYYDYIDRIGVRDEITYSLTNVFGIHKQSVGVDEEDKPVKRSSYLDFIRFNLEHGFDFKESRRDHDREEYNRRPFMDILSDLEVSPQEYLSLNSRSWFSSYDGEVTRHNHSVTVKYPEIGYLTTGLDFRNEPDEYWRKRKYLDERQNYLLHQGLLSRRDVNWGYYDRKVNMWNNVLHLNYFKPVDITLEHWYDFDKKETLEYKFTLNYIHQCFIITAEMDWDSDDTSYGISFALPGFWN